MIINQILNLLTTVFRLKFYYRSLPCLSSIKRYTHYVCETFKSDTMSVPVTCYGARFCYRYIALFAILCQHQYKASAFIRLLLYWLFDVKTCGQTYIYIYTFLFRIFCWKYFLRDISSSFERGFAILLFKCIIRIGREFFNLDEKLVNTKISIFNLFNKLINSTNKLRYFWFDLRIKKYINTLLNRKKHSVRFLA